jgi:hypothetical protein
MSRNARLTLLASHLFLAACGAPAMSPTTPSGQDGTAPSTTTAVKVPTAPPSPLENASVGNTTFTVYEGFMSPHQQPGEETDAPKLLAKALGLESAAVSVPREQRKSLGHGRIRFNRSLSRAFLDVEIEGVNPEDIMMFHVHCGPPGILGPIIVDLGEHGSMSKAFVNGKLSMELSNKNITFIKDMPHGLKPALPESCPAELGFASQAMTIASLEYLARKGVLYFNLHTKAHSFYGEMRGQIYGVKE